MRLRTIKPGYYTNEALADLAPLTRLLFSGLWCFADREGRFEWRPRRIKAEILPFDACDVESMLTDLCRSGFVRKYRVSGSDYGLVCQFSEHQRPHVNEQPSRCPVPPKAGRGTTKAVPEHNQGNPLLGSGIQSLGSGGGLGDAPPLADAHPAPAKPGRVRKEPSGLHAAVIAGWCERFERVKGAPYAFDGGKDGKHVKALLGFAGLAGNDDPAVEAVALTLIMGRADALLASDDQYFIDKGIDLGTLRSQWNRLGSAGKGKPRRNDKIGHAAPSGIEEFHNGRVDI